MQMEDLEDLEAYRHSPWTNRVNVTLGLSSSTTVRMIGCKLSDFMLLLGVMINLTSVHGQTSNSWSNVQPSTSSSLTKLSMLIMGIAS